MTQKDMKLFITSKLSEELEKVKSINVDTYEKVDTKTFLSILAKVKNLEYELEKEYSVWIGKQLEKQEINNIKPIPRKRRRILEDKQ